MLTHTTGKNHAAGVEPKQAAQRGAGYKVQGRVSLPVFDHAKAAVFLQVYRVLYRRCAGQIPKEGMLDKAVVTHAALRLFLTWKNAAPIHLSTNILAIYRHYRVGQKKGGKREVFCHAGMHPCPCI